MQTEALKLAAQNAKTGKHEQITWGLVEFQVTDLSRTVDFWTNSFGLIIHQQDQQSAELGVDDKTLFKFYAGASEPVRPGYLGMYHVCLGIPNQAEFSRLLQRLITRNVPFSQVDHLMSKSLYLHDPEGLEIEIGLETPERFGRFNGDNGFAMFDADDKPHSGRAPLDLASELSFAEVLDTNGPLSKDAFLSHIHFKVEELSSAANWFETIGFAKNLLLPNIGIADMGAGADYTHRVAMNTWDGKNLPPTPASMARLKHYELHVHDADVMGGISGLAAADNRLVGQDPSGTHVSLVPAY